VKLITAVIRPDALDDVIYAVEAAGARGLTVTEVMGFGQQYGHLGSETPADPSVLVLPKVRIDLVVHDEVAESLISAIAKSVRKGSVGDGKIWVSPVDSALRVRTGERDDAAL